MGRLTPSRPRVRKAPDEMHRAIDVLAKAIPNGQLMAAMGPLAFLGAAAEHIGELRSALIHAGMCSGSPSDCEDCRAGRDLALLPAKDRHHVG